MKTSLSDYCRQRGPGHLPAQWHPEKNGNLSPNEITFGSHKKVWWRCDKGHEWQASVWSRTSDGTGCPVCAGKVVVPGENDLASTFPETAAQWHPTKNEGLTPETVSPNSNRKVWWLCELGHEWPAIVSHRTRMGFGCPYCANRRVLPGFNDLATTHPNIAAQWHPELNGELTAQQVSAGSNKKVWWQCEDGHTWKAFVFSRTSKRRHGCPVCAEKVKYSCRS